VFKVGEAAFSAPATLMQAGSLGTLSVISSATVVALKGDKATNDDYRRLQMSLVSMGAMMQAYGLASGFRETPPPYEHSFKSYNLFEGDPPPALVRGSNFLTKAADPKYSASLGRATSTNYKATFFEAHPELEGKVIVHHAIEQQVLELYPAVISEAELHSLRNLRGIPKEINSEIHLSQIRKEWNQFYLEHPTATKAQLLEKATEIDLKFGRRFQPPVGGDQ
jgi:hypothetical protein